MLGNAFCDGVEPKLTLGFGGCAEVPKRLLVDCAVIEEAPNRPELEVGAEVCILPNGLPAAADVVGAAPKLIPELVGVADVEPNWKGALGCCWEAVEPNLKPEPWD